MKRLCIILALILMFCACGKESEGIIESSGQLEQITDDFEPDM